MDKKNGKEGMISPFEENQVRGEKFLMDYRLLDMMLEFQMNLKYLQM